MINALKVYVASSWRNETQGQVVNLCRSLGLDVYDFKNPPKGTGFAWSEVAQPGVDWKDWTQEEYLAALEHPRAIEGFDSEMNALIECDICILVFPAGVSASLEFGYAVGAGKRTLVYGMPREAGLMVKMADVYCSMMSELQSTLEFIIENQDSVHEGVDRSR